MNRLRVTLVLLGLAALGFGAQQLLTGGNGTRLTSSVPWLVGVLVLHDAVLAPVVAGIGWGLSRRVRGPALAVLAIGLYVAAVLVLVAVPALVTPGVSDNPTAVPRNYSLGLAVLLALDAVGTAGALVILRVRRRQVAPVQSATS
jgi:hypothetical protein